jgi:hypothetical protein
MCFNPAKSWQLGWYNDKRTTVDLILNGGTFSGSLVGIADYQSAGNRFVNVKVENGDTDLFIGFNLKQGINSGTLEAANKVTIQAQGSGYSSSSLVAELAENEEYTIQNYLNSGSDAVVKVGLIDTGSNPASATVEIVLLGPVSPTPAPVSPTPAPVSTTPAPVSPTPAPVSPTPAPVSPTPAPVSPTPAPVSPSPAPVSPTPAPVSPSPAPVSPTPAPVSPTPAPVSTTPAPAFPTSAPVSPTSAPINNNGQWALIFEEDFESGFGVFNDGGRDATITFFRSNDGSASLRIRDDSDSAKAYTDDYDVSSYSELRVHFFYYHASERFFLEYSFNGGSTWSVVQEFVQGTDFNLHEWMEVLVEFGACSVNNVRLQFRCDGSNNSDKIHIDTVRFEGK